MRTQRAVIALLMFTVSACAGTGGGLPTPEQLPSLEAALQKAPRDADAATRLGGAYISAKRYEDAKRTLAPFVEQNTANSSAYLYLGIANEELQDFTGARSAYEKYVTIGRDAKVKENIRGRLALVARKELKQQARVILDRERILSEEPPAPRTLAIMPFAFTGVSDEFKPLQAALADMLITDLSVSRAVVPVERVRMQALIDEMLLGQAGISDAANTTRAGKLLKAEHIVQGVMTMDGRQVRIEGNVLGTAQGNSRGQLNGQNQVDAIFDLEKALVFRIFELLSVPLTAAETERINENRTGSLLAFLAYGRGLDALDRGNYGEAAGFFNQATQLDPQFSRAQAQRVEASQLTQAGQTTTDQVASSASAGGSADAVAPTASAGDILKQTASEVNFSPSTSITGSGRAPDATSTQSQTRQNASQEAGGGQTGGVQQALKATITINIKRPGT